MKDFLKQLLPTLSWVDNAEKQFAVVSGYDEADTMLNSLRNVEFPLVMVEDIPEGYLSFEDTFLDNRTTSFWVMAPVKVADSEDRERVLRDCYSKGVEILKQVVKHSDYDQPCEGFDRRRTAYAPRGPMGAGCYGYEFMLTFRKNVDLSQ